MLDPTPGENFIAYGVLLVIPVTLLYLLFC